MDQDASEDDPYQRQISPFVGGTMEAYSVYQTKSGSRKNVQWMRSSTPKMRPAEMDQLLMLKPAAHLPLQLFYIFRQQESGELQFRQTKVIRSS